MFKFEPDIFILIYHYIDDLEKAVLIAANSFLVYIMSYNYGKIPKNLKGKLYGTLKKLFKQRKHQKYMMI